MGESKGRKNKVLGRAPAFYLLFFVLFIIVIISKEYESNLYSKITECNTEELHTRMTCYKNLLKSELESNNITRLYMKLVPYTSSLNENLADLNYHGTNCHVFTHAMGQILAAQYRNDPAEGISLCSHNCFSACAMSVVDYTAYLHDYDEEIINKTIDSCLPRYSLSCMHGAGHIYFDKNFININLIEDLSEKNLLRNYSWGNFGNLSMAFENCERFPEGIGRNTCYNGVTHRLYDLLHFRDHNWTRGIGVCNILDKYRQVCLERFIMVLGGMEAGKQLFSGNITAANSFCMQYVQLFGEIIGRKCYQGIGILIAMAADSLKVDQVFTDFKNNAPITEKLKYLAGLCRKIEKYPEECYNGVKLYDSLNLQQYAGDSGN